VTPPAGPLSDEEKAVVGTWMIDPTAMKDMILEEAKKASRIPTPEELAQVDEMVKGMTMHVEFKPDRTCTMLMKMGPMEEKGAGVWSFADGKYTIKTTEKNGEPSTDEKDATATLSDGKLTISGDAGPPIPMIRKPATP
jgi:hypothetical protein